MPRTKVLESDTTKKAPLPEKIIEVEEVEAALEIEEKPEVEAVPGVEAEEEEVEEDALLDTEEIDPFGDTWEQ